VGPLVVSLTFAQPHYGRLVVLALVSFGMYAAVMWWVGFSHAERKTLLNTVMSRTGQSAPHRGIEEAV
jgi:hypothetical protein